MKGSEISLWNDTWCGKYKLSDYTTVNADELEEMKVNDIISANNMWDTSVIDHLIPFQCKMDIMNTPLPVCTNLEVSPSWMGTSSGKFSIKSCYDIIAYGNDSDEENWSWLWKLKIPLKLILFIWTLRHGKNLNNSHRMIRDMTNDESCKLCGLIENNDHIFFCGLIENNDHIFRFCNRAVMVWNSYPVNISALHDVNVTFRSWLDGNLISKTHNSGNRKANVNFISVLWSTWKARNIFQFENSLLRKEEIVKEAMFFAKDIKSSFQQVSSSPNLKEPVLIRWNFPRAGTIKLNTDGSSMGNPGPTGFRGLARDDQGKWMSGFAGFIRNAMILKAELWAAREAMVLIKDKGWLGAIVEVDSANVLDLINSNDWEDHPLKVLIKDCKQIALEMSLDIQHTLREGNRCADAMAKLGVNQLESLVVYKHIPNSVKKLLEADEMGVNYPRGF
ncbi:hypothetical protein LguiA_023237 [Lonicera macranthoides]